MMIMMKMMIMMMRRRRRRRRTTVIMMTVVMVINGDSDDYIAGAEDKGDNINGNDNYRCIVRKKMTTMINKVINGKI